MTRRTIFGLVFLALVVLALLALQTPLLTTARGYAWNIFVHSVGRIFSLGPLTVDGGMQNEMDRLLAENIRLRAQESEYVRLKEQVGSPAYPSFRAIAATVEARPLDTFRAQLILNKGAADGITLGAPAVIYEAILVGTISELHEHTAVLQLLVHPSTNLATEIDHERHPRGLLVGRHYTSMRVTTIPRDVELKSGQAAVTVGRENLPAGLLVGRIGTITHAENEAYQEASLQLPYDIDQLRAVSILVLP